MKTKKNSDDSYHLCMRLFNEHIRIYSKKIILAMIFMLVVAAANATHAYMIKPVLDEIFVKEKIDMLKIIPIIVVVIAFIKAICAYYQNFLMKYVGQRVITDIQYRLYEHLIKSDLEYLNSSSSGMLISRFTNDISLLRNSMSNFLTGIAKELFTVIFLVGVMFYLSVTLSIITFVIFPIAIFPIIKMGRRMRRISHSTQEELGKYTIKLDDSFQAIRVIKSFMREKYETTKAKNMLENIFSLYVKAIRTESASSPIIEILSGVAIAAVIWYGGSEVIKGDTSPGSFFAFITAFITAYKPIKCIADLNNNLQEALAASKRLFTIFDEKPRIVDSIESKDLVYKNGLIEVKSLSYNYIKTKEALKSVSLSINPGKNIAFVGKSGSGKSTLLNLLLRFYDSSSGGIYIDGQDIKNVTIKSLREHISFVSQDVMLFDNNIFANIEYGKLGASQKEVEEASKAADAHEFVESFPDKYNTYIGQHGHKLSGGQKQRLSIARAILKNSDILIFDEATSALDNIAEKEIFKNLKKIRKGKTNIIVAHRLSTIIDADEIFVFKNGSIVEKGTHKELLNKKGEYTKLYEASLADEV